MTSAWLLCLFATFPQDTATPAPAEALLEFEMAPLSAWMTSPKDAALLEALGLLDARLRELPDELDWHDVPTPMLELALSACSGSIHFAVGTAEESDAAVPVRAELRLGRETGTQAERLAADLRQLFEMFELPFEAVPDSTLFESPVPFPIQTGAVTNDVIVRLGRRPVGSRSLRASLGRELLGESADVGAAGRLDVSGFLDAVADFAPGDVELDEMFTMMNTYGLQRSVYEWAMGSDALRARSVLRIRDCVANMSAAGLLPEARLTEKDLEILPADATWASVSTMDALDLFDLMRGMLAASGDGAEAMEKLEDGLAQVEGMLGLSLTEDILRPLGNKLWIYGSDSTGGGGLTSTVAIMELANSERFAATMNTLAQQIDGFGAGLARGYVKVLAQEADGRRWMSLRFPGVPVPVELTLAITATHAVIGLSPQAVTGALAQVDHAGDCLLEHAPFRAQVRGGFEGVTSVAWMNTPVLLRDGYGTMNMLCTTISNAMRSPRDAQRGPAYVLPTYPDLAAGALPSVTVTRVTGDDIVMETQSDRSCLVSGTGTLGAFFRSPLSGFLGLGVVAGLAGTRSMNSVAAPPDLPD